MAKYRVFTKKGCGTCRSVVSILKARQVDFSEIDVTTEYGQQLASRLHIMHSGAIIDENDNVVKLENVGIVPCAACN